MHAKFVGQRSVWEVSLSQCRSWAWRVLLSVTLADGFMNRDPPSWLPKSSSSFMSQSAWEVLGRRMAPIVWAIAIWFDGHIPHHATTLWFVVLGQLKM